MHNIKNNLKIRRKTFSTYDDWIDTTDKSINSSINNYQKIDKKSSLGYQLSKQMFRNQQQSSPLNFNFLKVKQNNVKNKAIQDNKSQHVLDRQSRNKRSKSKKKLQALKLDYLDEYGYKSSRNSNEKDKYSSNQKSIFTERIHAQEQIANQTLNQQKHKVKTFSNRNLNKSLFVNSVSKKLDQTSIAFNQELIISHHFQGSFKAIFNQLAQLFYLQLFLKKSLQHKALQIWNFLVQKSNNFSNKEINDFYVKKRPFRQTATSKQLIFKFLQIFQEYQVRQIKNMVYKQISISQSIKYQDFLGIFQKEKIHVDLMAQMEYQNKYIKNSQQSCSLVKTFFRTLIQMTDCQIVIKKLIKANERQFFNIVLNISNGNYISQSKLSQYLTSQNISQGKYAINVAKIKIQTFLHLLKLKENLNFLQKMTKYQFIKRMKDEEN